MREAKEFSNLSAGFVDAEKMLAQKEAFMRKLYKRVTGLDAAPNFLQLEEIAEYICQHFENIINQIPGNVYWLDKNNIYLGCNSEHAKVAGLLNSKEIIGKTNFDLPWKTAASFLDKINNRVMETGKKHVVEESGTVSTGKYTVMLTEKKPLYDLRGDLIGVLGISLDITERKRAEELQVAKEIAEKTAKSMEIITGAIAHEIRTPLAGISMAIDVLKNDIAVNEKKQDIVAKVWQCIEMVKKAIRTADHIVSTLLVKLRNVLKNEIDSANFEVCSATISINDALSLYPYEDGQQELIEWKQDEVCDFYYYGSELLTKHILFNLVKNSFHAVKEAGRGKITINIKSDNKGNYIIFRDTASGIKADNLGTLFDSFSSHKKDGTGLGLAFCRVVMRSYGGDITCNSVEGEFTEFVLYFPFPKDNMINYT